MIYKYASIKKDKVNKVVFIILVSALFIFINSTKTQAAAISENAPLSGSSTVAGNGTRPYYAVGTGAFDGRFSWVKVYVPNGDYTDITIHQACSLDVGSPTVTYYLNDLSAGTSTQSETYENGSINYSGVYSATRTDSGACASTINFPRIGSSDGTTSQVVGHERWRVFYLVAKISAAAGDNERSFWVSSSENASYVGASRQINDGNVSGLDSGYVNGFGIYQRNAPSLGSERWFYEIEFAPTCAEAKTNVTRTVKIYDADNGIYSPQTLSMDLARANRDGGSYSGYRSWGSGSFGGQHARDSFDFTSNNAYRYKLNINGINWRNTLQIEIPFDQIDALPTHPVGSNVCASDPPPPLGAATCLRYREFNTNTGHRYRVSIFTGQNALGGATYSSGGNTYVTRGGGLTPGDIRTERQEINWGTGGLPSPSQGIAAFDGNGGHQDTQYANNLNQWHTVVSEEWEHLSSGDWKYIRAQVYDRPPCNVTCSLDVGSNVPGANLPNAVRADIGFTVSITLTNNGPDVLPTTHPNGNRMIANGDYGQYYTANNSSIGIGPTESITVGSFNLPAPGGPPRSFNLGSMYPDYYRLSGIGPLCSASVNVYQRFDITPSANFAADQDFENPETIQWNTGGNNSGPAVNSPYTSTMFRLVRDPSTGALNYPGYDIQSSSGNASFGNQTLPSSGSNYIFNDPIVGRGYRATGGQSGTWMPGDQLCSKIYINNGKGWAGPGDVAVEAPVETQNCPSITNRPYLSAYGGDVAAGGGGLGLACSNSGSISSYYKNAGSGAQFAAYAMDSISGFKSAFLRDGAFPSPNSPNGLTFGNTPSLGQYKLVDCATDFFNVDQYEDGDSRKNTAVPGSISPSGLPDDSQSLRTGNLTLNGGGFTGQHSVFVDGDVFITGNIVYTSTSWTNISEIPYFSLVARGNIYISQDVTQLDGRYIAQPKSDTEGGHIYTCAYASDDPARNISAGDPVPTNPGSELWDQCGGATNSRRLVVNGQFVARTIHFLRTIDTLSNGVSRETSASSRAGEVFNLSPESFLGKPATRPKSTSTSGEYQKITTLPPIL